jgi:LPXTG-motif cell wall-anchored protein
MGGPLPEETQGHQSDEARQLKEEIERTREHLGETVDQLVDKADVKGRAKAQAAELTGRAKSTAADAVVKVREQVTATKAKTGTVSWMMAAGAVALAVAALVVWRRGKR